MLDKIEKAEEEGLAIGMDKGINKGVEQSVMQEKENIVKNMLKENIGIELISKVNNLYITEINRLSKGLLDK